MTEQEKLWEILENASKKNNKKPPEEKRPNRCSFCQKKTKRLTRQTVGGIRVYLCKFCMDILKYMREKRNDD